MVSFPSVRVKKRSLIELGKMCCVVVVVIDCKTKNVYLRPNLLKKLVRKGSSLLLLPGWGLVWSGGGGAQTAVNVLLLFLSWLQNLEREGRLVC